MVWRKAAGALVLVAFLLVGGRAGAADSYPWSGFEGHFGPGLLVFPSEGAWDGVIVTWTGIEGVARYEVFYQNSLYQDRAEWAGQVQGGNSAGVPLRVPVQDKTLSGARARYEVRAVGLDGTVIASDGFEIVHSVYVAFDRWSISKLADAIAERLEGLFIITDRSPGYVQLVNVMSKIQNYGPMGEAAKAKQAVDDLVAGVKAGHQTSVEALEREWFTFPLHLPDGSVVNYTMPVVQVLALDGWGKLWSLASAGLWGGFAVWLVTRLSPKPQA